MNADKRQDAIQGLRRSPADRITYMLDNMDRNLAYSHAFEEAGGDAQGTLLKHFQDRFRWYREGWRGLPGKAIDEKLYGDEFSARGHLPLCLDLETAALCDLACPFCYRQWVATPDKIMNADLAFRMIDQAAELGIPSIKFNWRGEPLLNPKLPKFVAHAKKRGIVDTIINTNATNLDEAMARSLIEAGLDYIIYSFDGGSAESYNRMRPGRFAENTFDAVYANIVGFSNVRAEIGSPFPFTKIQMIITEETFHEQDSFFELFDKFVDDVSVKAYTERGGKLSDIDSKNRVRLKKALPKMVLGNDTPYWRDAEDKLKVAIGRLPCEQPYQRLMVAYDGRVAMCCYDWGVEHAVGYADKRAIDNGDQEIASVLDKAMTGTNGFELLKNIKRPRRLTRPRKRVKTLKEIWHGNIVNDVRRHHVQGRLESVSVCKSCPFKDTYKWETVDA